MSRVLFFLASALVFAQDEPIRVDVDYVNLLFTVHDKKGALIGNLEKNDFTVFEDGKQQTIKQFVRESDLPLTIGLLIDVSRSQENLVGVEQNAASQFFAHVLRPKDLAFVISFGSEAELLQDYTSSPKLLRKSLEGLRVNSDPGGIHPGPVPTVSQPRGTVLYDAVYLAAAEQLRNQVGRKALVLITDGEDQGSRLKLEEAVEAAQKADAIVYSIYYVDYAFYRQAGFFLHMGGEGALRKISAETGGRVFQVDRKHTLEDIFNQIQEEMRSQYSLAYTPSNRAKDGSFRRIEIRPANRDLKVQARRGYYALKPDAR